VITETPKGALCSSWELQENVFLLTKATTFYLYNRLPSSVTRDACGTVFVSFSALKDDFIFQKSVACITVNVSRVQALQADGVSYSQPLLTICLHCSLVDTTQWDTAILIRSFGRKP
jgi:hypothetical protein